MAERSHNEAQQEDGMLKLYGVNASPFVRKVRVVLAEKDLSYEHDPVIPIGVSDDYKKISPLGKIPALADDGKVLPDSSVICAYLDRRYPNPPLYPSDPYEYGRALWLEEYTDTALVEVAGPKIFFQRVIRPLFFQQECDEAVVEKAINEELPIRFDYLDRQLHGKEYLAGDRFSVADIALGSQLVNLAHARVPVDAKRWPNLAALAARVHARPSFKRLIEEERGQFAATA
jgi:glutathione S-transferase